MDSNGSWFSCDVGEVAQPERKIARPINTGNLDNLRCLLFIIFSFEINDEFSHKYIFDSTKNITS